MTHLTFVDKSDYQVIELCHFVDETKTAIFWRNKNTTGVFKQGLASNHLRDDEPFYPFKEVQQERIVDPAPEETEAEKRAKATAKQQKAINEMTVEVDGMVFQANELSRQRMADAILGAQHSGETEHTWRLADNSQVTITLDQLKRAHYAAIAEFGKLIIK